MRYSKSTDVYAAIKSLRNEVNKVSNDEIEGGIRDLEKIGGLLSSTTIEKPRIEKYSAFLKEGIIPLYKICPAYSLKVSSAILHIAFHKYIVPPPRVRDASSVTSDVWISITNALIHGILGYLDEDSPDSDAIGPAIYPVACSVLVTSLSSKKRLPTMWVKELCNMLTDAAAGCKRNIEMLRLKSILGPNRLAELLGQTTDFLILEALLELLSNMLPGSADIKGRSRFLDDFQKSVPSDGTTALEIRNTIENATSQGSWETVSSNILECLSQIGIQYPQPFPSAQFTACGKLYRQIAPFDRFYVDHSSIIANIPADSGELDTFQVPFASIIDITTTVDVKAKACNIRARLREPPLLSGQPISCHPPAGMTLDVQVTETYVQTLRLSLEARGQGHLMPVNLAAKLRCSVGSAVVNIPKPVKLAKPSLSLSSVQELEISSTQHAMKGGPIPPNSERKSKLDGQCVSDPAADDSTLSSEEETGQPETNQAKSDIRRDEVGLRQRRGLTRNRPNRIQSPSTSSGSAESISCNSNYVEPVATTTMLALKWGTDGKRKRESTEGTRPSKRSRIQADDGSETSASDDHRVKSSGKALPKRSIKRGANATARTLRPSSSTPDTDNLRVDQLKGSCETPIHASNFSRVGRMSKKVVKVTVQAAERSGGKSNGSLPRQDAQTGLSRDEVAVVSRFDTAMATKRSMPNDHDDPTWGGDSNDIHLAIETRPKTSFLGDGKVVLRSVAEAGGNGLGKQSNSTTQSASNEKSPATKTEPTKRAATQPGRLAMQKPARAYEDDQQDYSNEPKSWLIPELQFQPATSPTIHSPKHGSGVPPSRQRDRERVAREAEAPVLTSENAGKKQGDVAKMADRLLLPKSNRPSSAAFERPSRRPAEEIVVPPGLGTIDLTQEDSDCDATRKNRLPAGKIQPINGDSRKESQRERPGNNLSRLSVNFVSPPPKYTSPLLKRELESRAPNSGSSNGRQHQSLAAAISTQKKVQKSVSPDSNAIITVLNNIHEVIISNVNRKSRYFTSEALAARNKILQEASTDLDQARLESARCYNAVLEMKGKYDTHGEELSRIYEELRTNNKVIEAKVIDNIRRHTSSSVMQNWPERLSTDILPDIFLLDS